MAEVVEGPGETLRFACWLVGVTRRWFDGGEVNEGAAELLEALRYCALPGWRDIVFSRAVRAWQVEGMAYGDDLFYLIPSFSSYS